MMEEKKKGLSPETMEEVDSLAGWIAVHEDVNGPKLRRLAKCLKTDKAEAVGILVFLWFWGRTNADVHGKILDADREDIELDLESCTKLNIQDVVDALFETGWLDQKEDGLYLHDWEDWQDQWYKAIERRENDKKRKQEERAAKKAAAKAKSADESESEEQGHGEGFLPPDQPGQPPDPEPQTPKYSNEFETFWKAYPRSIDKGMAYKKYQARRKDGYSAEELLAAAQAYASECKRKKTEKEYIKHPKTFLGDAMPFVEYIQKQPAQPAMKPGENPFRRGMIGNG